MLMKATIIACTYIHDFVFLIGTQYTMALQATMGASGLDLENFPRLTFSGFKKRKPDRKSSKASMMGRSPSIVDWQRKQSHTSSPALKRARSAHDYNSMLLNDGCSTCTTDSVRSSNSHPSLNRVSHYSNDSQTVLLSFGSEGSCAAFVTTQNRKDSTHSHSDLCLKSCDISHGTSGKRPSISLVNSHSSLKCGTNIKTWYVKVQLKNTTPDNTIDVSIDNQIVKIKIKYGKRVSGFEKFFGAKQMAVRKNLRFSGILDESSLRTKIDKEGFLVIQLIEVMF